MPRPRFAKLDPAKQHRIIEAAKVEFAESGYERASYNKIIEAAGLSKGAMYYYFDDKLDLYVTVLEDVNHALLSTMSMDEWCAEGGFWVAIEGMLRSCWEYIIAHPEMAALAKPMKSFSRSMRSEGRLAELYTQWSSILRELLHQGQLQGEVRDDRPLELLVEIAMSLDETLEFWLLEHLSELSEDPVEEVVAIAVELMRRVLAPAALASVGAPTAVVPGPSTAAATAASPEAGT